ncbi:unnamed protein product [Caenorhabditis brenneri]
MGLCYSKLLNTTFNSFNPFYYPYSSYSSVPIAKNLPLRPFCDRNCSTKWSPTAKNFPLRRLPFFALLEVFKSLDPIELCPVTSFEYAGWSDTDQCWLSVFDYIIHNQTQRLDSFRLSGRFNKDDLERALQNARNIRKINIHLLGTLHFTTNFQPTCEQLTFRSSCFLTISLDLMRLNSCKYIELALSSFTCHALDVFMKEWKTGSFPNLQYLLIKRCKLNWADTILGFRRFEMRQLGVRRRLVIDENLSVDCTGGVDIQSDNGKKATMQMDRLSPNWFELFVWNN